MISPTVTEIDSEVLRTPLDRNSRGLVGREGEEGREPRRPPMYFVREAVPGQWGSFPASRGDSFLTWALRELGARSHMRTLHVCSGALGPEVLGIRVDLRALCRPDVVSDGRALPFRSGSFDVVLIDPPYSIEYAAELYGTSYPRPSHLLQEAARVLAPGGRVGILHFLVPRAVETLRTRTVHGVTTGPGYRIRAFTVMEKASAPLFEGQPT